MSDNYPINISDPSILEKATYAVEDQLQIRGFIYFHINKIFDKLEQCHAYAMETDRGKGELVFFAESLPLISSIVHVGSTIENFRHATEWIKSKSASSDVDPVSILSALTFIYIINKAKKEFSGDYTFTDLSLTRLKNEQQNKIPEDLLERLKSLEKQRWNSEEEFVEMLEAAIGKTSVAQYKSIILRYVRKDEEKQNRWEEICNRIDKYSLEEPNNETH